MLLQKYKLELTTGIHACIGHASCVNTREFLKDTTTADSHENDAWKSEFTFFQSLSWLFQLAYFVKCKHWLWLLYIQLHEENEFCHCLFTSFTKREIDGKEMFKKAWCTCKVLVLPYQASAYLISRPRCILNFTIHCDLSKTEYSRGKLNCSCW